MLNDKLMDRYIEASISFYFTKEGYRAVHN